MEGFCMRIMIDSNIYDDLITDQITLDKVTTLQADGHIILLTTHVQDDEISKTPDLTKLEKMQLLPLEEVGTSVFILNKSRLGKAKLGTGESGQISYNKIKKNNTKHVEDAIIATTAGDVADTFVTNDKTLRKKILSQNTALRILDYSDFKELINNW
jgi:predicted nucleic acid-binding protein